MSLPAPELKELFEVGQNRVKITLTDVRSFTYSSSAYYLVMESREGRLASATGMNPTMTITPTMRATMTATSTKIAPTMTATPTKIAPTMTATSTEIAPTMTATPTEMAPLKAPTSVADYVPTTTPLNQPTIKGHTVVTPTITATAALSGTAVAAPAAAMVNAEKKEPTKSANQWPTWLIWPSVIVLVIGLLLRRRQHQETLPQTRLMGWLEGMDWQSGDVLPLVNLSVYPKGAAIVANPLRLIGLGAEIEEIEEQVIAELQPSPSGVPELVIESEKKGLMAEEVRIGSLLLEYRNPLAVRSPMMSTHEMSWT